MPSAYYFVLPYAEDEGTQMFLAQRQLIQWRIDGKQVKYGQIPNWAGQWVLVGGKGKEDEPATEAALRLFLEQTGINLSEPQAQTYGVESETLQELRDKDYNPFTVLFMELSGEGLIKLKTDVRKNINDRTVFDGTLQDADVVAGPLAPEKVGPIEPPANGWRDFLIINYFGGVTPGQLNTTIDILQMQITQRSKASAEWYLQAIAYVPEKPITALLTGLEVSGASPTNGDWKATYQPGSFINIRAVTDPDTPEVHELIVWVGGIEDFDDPYDRRLVSLAQITEEGVPLVVTAELVGSISPAQSARFIIVPKLDDLEVSGAEEVTPELWSAGYSAVPGAAVTVTAKLSPDTAEAYTHLEWSGGEQDDKYPNDRRLVPRDTVTAKDQPVVVKASLNPSEQREIEVVPTAITLVVTNATQANGDEYVANYDAANTDQITITATTTPDSSEAWSHIVWTNGNPGNADNQRLVPVDQITNVGASIDVTATIPGPHSATAQCKVVPRITALTVVAYGFQDQGQVWYTLMADDPPAIVGVTTAPATAEAWAQVIWTNTTGPGKAGNERVVSREEAGNIEITATIPDGDHPQLDLFVRPPLPLGDLTLQVLNITFDGGGSGVRSDANIGLGRQWVRNPANNPPQTYPRNTQASLQASLDVTHAPFANVAIDVRATGFFPHANGGSTNVVWQQNNIAVNAAPPPQQLAFALAGGLPFLPNEVNYQDTGGGNFPLNIIWEMRLTGGGNTWVGFDTTVHPFYVTLGAAVGDPRAYWTELKISCLAANGQNTPANTIAAIYQPFTALNPMTGVNPQMVRTSDGATLKYWYLWVFGIAPGQRNSTMLANPAGNGSCLAWAMMLVDMLRLHGINTGGVDSVLPDPATAPAAEAFLVKTWDFIHPPASSGNGWSHTMGLNCGWTNGPGQNQQYPPPVFNNHYIVEETIAPTYYDPSYGSAAQATHPAWEANAIDALKKRQGLPTPNVGYIKGAPGAPATVLVLNGINFPNY